MPPFCFRDCESNPGYSASGFRSFIYYLYTNRIEPPVQTADYAIGKTVEKGRHLNESYISGWQCTGEFLFYFVELIQMGHYYNEMDLVKRAERQLILFIDEENALKIYDDLALKFDLEVCFLSFHFLGLAIDRKFSPCVIVSTPETSKACA